MAQKSAETWENGQVTQLRRKRKIEGVTFPKTGVVHCYKYLFLKALLGSDVYAVLSRQPRSLALQLSRLLADYSGLFARRNGLFTNGGVRQRRRGKIGPDRPQRRDCLRKRRGINREIKAMFMHEGYEQGRKAGSRRQGKEIAIIMGRVGIQFNSIAILHAIFRMNHC